MSKIFSSYATRIFSLVGMFFLGLLGFSSYALWWTIPEDWSEMSAYPEEVKFYPGGTLEKNIAYVPGAVVDQDPNGNDIVTPQGPYVKLVANGDVLEQNFVEPVIHNNGEDSYLSFDLTGFEPKADELVIFVPVGYYLVDGDPCGEKLIQIYIKDQPSEACLVSEPAFWTDQNPLTVSSLGPKVRLSFEGWEFMEISGVDADAQKYYDEDYGAVEFDGVKIPASNLSLVEKGVEGYKYLDIELGNTYTSGNHDLYIPQWMVNCLKLASYVSAPNATLFLTYKVSPMRTEPRNTEAVYGVLEGIKVIGEGVAVASNKTPTYVVKANDETLGQMTENAYTGAQPEFGGYDVSNDVALVKFANGGWAPDAPNTNVIVTIPAGTFSFGGTVYNEPIEVNYYHHGEVPVATGIPVEGSKLASLSKVYFSWGDNITLAAGTQNKKVTVTRPDGSQADVSKYTEIRHIYNEDSQTDSKEAKSSILAVDLSAIAFTQAGNYTINLPEGVVTVASGYNTPNKAQDFTYIINPIEFTSEYTVDPTPGDVEEFKTVNVKFANGTIDYVDLYADMRVTLNGRPIDEYTNKDGQHIRALINVAEDGKGLTVLPQYLKLAVADSDSDEWLDGPFTLGGTYEVVIPANTFMFDVDGTKVFFKEPIRFEYYVPEEGYMKPAVVLDPTNDHRLADIVAEFQGNGILLNYSPRKILPNDDPEYASLESYMYLDGDDTQYKTTMVIVRSEIVEEDSPSTGIALARVEPSFNGQAQTGLSVAFKTRWPFESPEQVPGSVVVDDLGHILDIKGNIYTGKLRFEIPAGIVKDSENGDLNPAQTVIVTIAPMTETEPTVSPETDGIDGMNDPTFVTSLNQVVVSWDGVETLEYTGGETIELQLPAVGDELPQTINLIEAGKVSLAGNKVVLSLNDLVRNSGVGEYQILIGKSSLLLRSEQGLRTNQNIVLRYYYVEEIPELPEATATPEDGYANNFIDDHMSVVWGYNPIQLVDRNLITFTKDGVNQTISSVDLVEVIDGTGKEDNPNIDSGDGAGEEEETFNTLVVNFGDMIFEAGTYVVNIPAGTVKVNVNGVWMPNEEVNITYVVFYKMSTSIEPTVTLVGREYVDVTWNDCPIELTKDFEAYLTSNDHYFRPDSEVEVVDGKTLRFDISGLDLADGDYSINITPESVMINEAAGAVAGEPFSPYASTTKYSAWGNLKFKLETKYFAQPDEITPADGSTIGNVGIVEFAWDNLSLAITEETGKNYELDKSKVHVYQNGVENTNWTNWYSNGLYASKVEGTNEQGGGTETFTRTTIKFNPGDGAMWFLKGEIKIVIEAGFIQSVDGELNPELTVSFTSLTPMEQTVVVNWTPEAEDGVASFKVGDDVIITAEWYDNLYDVAYTPESFNTTVNYAFVEGYNADNDRTGRVNVSEYMDIKDGKIVFDFSSFAAGSYDLTIPEGCVSFVDGLINLDAAFNFVIEPVQLTLSPSKPGETDDSTQSGTIDNDVNIIKMSADKDWVLVYVDHPEGTNVRYKRTNVQPHTATSSNVGTQADLADDDDFQDAVKYDGHTVITLDTGTKGTLTIHYVGDDGQPTGEQEYSYEVLRDVPTGIDGIAADEEGVEYYTLDGIKVQNPERGIYIRVEGGKTTKVVK